MEQTELMRRYPPSHIATELRKQLPTQPEDALVLAKNREDKITITGDAHVTRGCAIAVIAEIISDKLGNLWTSFDFDDIRNSIIPDSFMFDPVAPVQERKAHLGMLTAITFCIADFRIKGLFEETNEETREIIPTDRFIEYVIEHYSIEPKQ